ncbi:hypothetical protein FN846DRAFT_892550 [Sphaerosporella brunnea]|uniref:Uncharacterized protein n=1 Tax=Sphaerosporella brunnea TaxID=1250544 RepID=A0A5J5EPM4_9PEZI|nr:hypothetical protein FN846DRAFT_892550 [Sphaerosporella brunnea]
MRRRRGYLKNQIGRRAVGHAVARISGAGWIEDGGPPLWPARLRTIRFNIRPRLLGALYVLLDAVIILSSDARPPPRLCSHSQPVLLRDRTGLHLAFPSSSSNGPGHLSDEVDGTECSQRPSTKTASQRRSTAVNGIIVSRVQSIFVSSDPPWIQNPLSLLPFSPHPNTKQSNRPPTKNFSPNSLTESSSKMGWKCPKCETIVADHLRSCSNCNYTQHVRRFARNTMARMRATIKSSPVQGKIIVVQSADPAAGLIKFNGEK